MLTAKDIYVGSVIQFKSGKIVRITQVHAILSRQFNADMLCVETGRHHTNHSGLFFNWSVVNNNRITVSSLDYQSNDKLDDKDKEIIKEYLNGHH